METWVPKPAVCPSCFTPRWLLSGYTWRWLSKPSGSHFGVGAPPIFEPILVVGSGCSLGVWDFDPWPHDGPLVQAGIRFSSRLQFRSPICNFQPRLCCFRATCFQMHPCVNLSPRLRRQRWCHSRRSTPCQRPLRLARFADLQLTKCGFPGKRAALLFTADFLTHFLAWTNKELVS